MTFFFLSTFKKIVKQPNFTNDGKFFHSFEAAARNAREAAAVLTLGSVSRFALDERRVLTGAYMYSRLD